MRNRPASDNLLNALSLIGICLWISVPLISGMTGLKTLALLVLSWVLTAKPRLLASALVGNFWFVAWYAYMLILLLLKVWGYGRMSPLGFFPGVLIWGLSAIVLRYYELNSNRMLLSRACAASLIGWAVGAAVSAVQLQRYPLASRILATAQQSEIDYSALGIGGFGFVYGSIIIVVALVYLARRPPLSKVSLRVLLVLGLIAIGISVIASQYATALLFLIVTLSFSCLAPSSKKGLALASVLLLGTVPLLMGRLGTILTRIAGWLPDGSVATEKLLDVAPGVDGLGFGPQASVRRDLYAQSVDLFLRSPLFGQTTAALPGELGAHSAWADLLAAFGFVGALPFALFLLIHARQRLRSAEEPLFANMLIIVYVYVFVLGFLNPLIYLPQIGFALCFVMPAAAYTSSAHLRTPRTLRESHVGGSGVVRNS